jgi:hypothetical protein
MTATARRRVTAWARLAAGVVLLALAVAGIHATTTRAGGPAARVWTHNVRRGLNASALFYTELGDVREFLDARGGRYGGGE